MNHQIYEKIKNNHETGIEIIDDDNGNSGGGLLNSIKNNNDNSNKKKDGKEEEEGQDDKDLIKIKVKHGEDPIVYIKLKPTDKVQLFKSNLLKVKDKPSHFNCRIIYNGKMLRDDQTIQECKLNNESVVICLITEPISLEPTIAILPTTAPNTTSTSTTITTTNTGVDQDFILDMERTRMLLNGGHNGGGINIGDDDEINGFHRPRYSFPSSGSATRESLELFLGLCIGFFFGILSLFWVGRDNLPRTTKLGIVIGVIFSISLSLVKMSSIQVNS